MVNDKIEKLEQVFFDEVGYVIVDKEKWITDEKNTLKLLKEKVVPLGLFCGMMLLSSNRVLAQTLLKSKNDFSSDSENLESFQPVYKVFQNGVEITQNLPVKKLKKVIKQNIKKTPELLVAFQSPMIDLSNVFSSAKTAQKVVEVEHLVPNALLGVKTREIVIFASGAILPKLLVRGGFLSDAFRLGSFAYDSFKKHKSENSTSSLFETERNPKKGFSIPYLGTVSTGGIAVLALLIYMLSGKRIDKNELISIPQIFSKPSNYERFSSHLGRNKVIYLSILSTTFLVLYLTKEKNGLEKLLATSLSQIERAQASTIRAWKSVGDLIASTTARNTKDLQSELKDARRELSQITEKHNNLRNALTKAETLLNSCTTTTDGYKEIATEAAGSYEKLLQTMNTFLINNADKIINDDGSRIKDLISIDAPSSSTNLQNKLKLIAVGDPKK
jgi:hypothetical protein